MPGLKVFISSVQTEFSEERNVLADYIMNDSLLGRFFQVFIFESLPASAAKASHVYQQELRNSDVYIGLFGKHYGSEDEHGVSPTEHEYNLASELNIPRLVFLTDCLEQERNPKMTALIRKAESHVVRRVYYELPDLKSNVYASLVSYLEENEYLRIGPFDASVCRDAVMEDLDNDRMEEFIRVATARRGFPLTDKVDKVKLLTHLNLIRPTGISNAAILLFGKQPQRFVLGSEVKCAQFHGDKVMKPMPVYQVYKGDVFQLINQTVDFVLSRIDVAVSARTHANQASIEYEIPRAVVTEAIVNAIAHRDYSSMGSVQVMLFRDRLEISNPGHLPHNLTLDQLKLPHSSFPRNPLLAEPLYLAGFIERMGTGIADMLEIVENLGMAEPVFSQADVFKTTIWRNTTGQATGQATVQVDEGIRRLLIVLSGTKKRSELQDALDLRHREFFIDTYLNPSILGGYVEMTIPNKPNSPSQKYRLSDKGEDVRMRIMDSLTVQVTEQVTEQVTVQVTEQVEQNIHRLVLVIDGEMSRLDLQVELDLKHRMSFIEGYLQPALDNGYITLTIPDKPTSRLQKYKLTSKGIMLKKKLRSKQVNK